MTLEELKTAIEQTIAENPAAKRYRAAIYVDAVRDWWNVGAVVTDEEAKLAQLVSRAPRRKRQTHEGGEHDGE